MDSHSIVSVSQYAPGKSVTLMSSLGLSTLINPPPTITSHFTLFHHPAVLGLAAALHRRGPSAVRSSKVEKVGQHYLLQRFSATFLTEGG